jgi:hypothetical protein
LLCHITAPLLIQQLQRKAIQDHFDQLLVEFRLKNDRFIRAIALRSSLELPLSDNRRRFPLTQETREAWYFNLWLLLLSGIECVSPSNAEIYASKEGYYSDYLFQA